MEEMRDFLRICDLSQYATIFEDMGYDSVDHLVGMSQREMVDLRQFTNMKPGHFARLLKSIEEARGPATPSEGSYPSAASISASPVSDSHSDVTRFGPIEVGPRVLVPRSAVAQMAQTGPNETGPKEVNGPLLKIYNAWPEARLVSLNHSTCMGCSTMIDNKKSGGRRKILRCRSVLSKKKVSGEDDGPKCPYMLLWTKDRKGDWKLNETKSILEHIDFCSSGQRVTQFELLRDAQFIRSQQLGKLSTGKAAANLALGYNGRMSGSVKDFTARRARNTIKHFNDVDYDDDWSKLNEWGQKFMELNQECLFHLEKDEKNRCAAMAQIFGPCMCFACWPTY